MGLPSRFVLKTVLIIEGCFCCYWAALAQHLHLLCFPWCRTVGRRHCRDRWPKVAKGASQTIRGHVQYIKSWGRKEEERNIRNDHICLPSHHYMQLSRAWLSTCPARGKWWTHFLFCFVCMYVCIVPINLPFSQLTDSLAFTLPILSPMPLVGSQWVAVYCSVADWGYTIARLQGSAMKQYFCSFRKGYGLFHTFLSDIPLYWYNNLPLILGLSFIVNF